VVEARDSFPTLELTGTARERGRVYGEESRSRIEDSVEYYESLFGVRTGMTWASVTEVARQWVPVCEEFAPELVEEMRGIAEGSGRDFSEILTLNARGEVAYDRGFKNTAVGADNDDSDEPADGCSSFALLPEATGDGHTYCGQNWDWREGVRSTVMVLRIVQPPRPTVIMHVEAGQIGRQGGNSAGIALNANGLGGRFDKVVGVPQTLIRRRVLDAASIHEALSVLTRTRQHIASNALVTHRDGFAIDLETTPGPHAAIHPHAGVLVHGNHYQASVPPQLAASHRPNPVDSLYRVPRLESALGHVRTAADTSESRERIRSAMSDHFGYPHSVCTHPDETDAEVLRWSTLLASCVDLTTGEYLIAAGQPCSNPFLPIPWNLYDGPVVQADHSPSRRSA